MSGTRRTAEQHVVVAGGGIAAIETVLALRFATASVGQRITLVSPDPELRYRPLAVAEPFGGRAARRYDLVAICRDLGVELVADTLAAVDPGRGALRLGGGAEIGYDALVVAVGARQRPALRNAFTFAGAQAPEGLGWIVRRLTQGRARTAAFVVPAGVGWALPVYELALLTARRLADADAGETVLTLVTPEDRPLAIFQGAGSDAVARLLADAGVAVATSTYVRDYDGATLMTEPGGGRIAADHVVALPRLEGPAIAGLPADPQGFVRIDDRCRVPGAERVWAIGDATTFPVKQGGIATQQADAVAAAVAGGGDRLPPLRPHLRAVLTTGGAPLYLTATITAGESIASAASERCSWWPPHKIAARHLAPYLADRDPIGDASRLGAADR